MMTTFKTFRCRCCRGSGVIHASIAGIDGSGLVSCPLCDGTGTVQLTPAEGKRKFSDSFLLKKPRYTTAAGAMVMSYVIGTAVYFIFILF